MLTDRQQQQTGGGATQLFRAVAYPSATWLSTKEAAKRLGLTTSTLYRLIDDGQLPAYRFGRVIRLKANDIDAFIASSMIKPGSLQPTARREPPSAR